MSESSISTASPWWVPLALVLLAALPFWPAVDGDFIEDDRPIIRDRIELRDVSHIPEFFGQTYWPGGQQGGLYRPLSVSSYALDRILWGADASGGPSRFGVHASNLILNALAVLLLFQILRARLSLWIPAAVGAALFAVHPVHVEAVSHMVGRADLAMTVFFLAAFALHSHGTAARVLAAGFYLLSCMCKEMAVVLPGLLFVDSWLRSKDESAGLFLRRVFVELTPCALALGSFILLRGWVLGAASVPPVSFALYLPAQYLAFPDPAPGEVLLTMTHALGEISRLLIAPFSLSADYSGFPHSTRLAPAVLLSAALLVGVLVGVILALRRGLRSPFFWLVWFALTWLPVSNLLFASGIVMAERVLYLPSVALAGVVGSVARLALESDRRWLVLPMLLIAGFAALTVSRAALWNDARTLYEETVVRSRYSGHIAKSGLVAELMRDQMAMRDPQMRARARDLARASVAQRATTTNLRQLAALDELAGDVESALANRTALYHVNPSDLENRAGLLRGLDRLIARHESEGDTYEALRRAGSGYLVAQQTRSPRLLEEWTRKVDRAYELYIEEAIASGDREEARRRIETLARNFPRHRLLGRYRSF
ncbi:MAG: hypothetical protein GY725_20310 [bacterium]|nr:hypothetical protein [bacterium]